MHLVNLDETLEKIAALEAASDLGKILSHKWHDHISGGLADKRSPADFPREDLIKGMAVEMEHTSDPSVACEIAMDHLMEDPHYYNHEQDMAKEVSDKIGHVLSRDSGMDKSAELAGDIGSFMALMEKKAIMAPGALAKAVTGIEKTVMKAPTVGVKSMSGAGKVLPMVHPGHVPTNTGGFAHADTIMDAPKTIPNKSMATARQANPTGSLASPARSQMPTSAGVRPAPTPNAAQPANDLLGRVNEVQNRAAHQADFGRVVDSAKAQGKAGLPGTPTQAVHIPEGRLPSGRRMGADEWVAANPELVAKNKAIAAQRDAIAAPVGHVTPNPAVAPQAAPVPGWAGKLDQEMGPVAKHKPMNAKLQKNLEAIRARDAAAKAQPTAAGPQTGSSFGGGHAETAASPGQVVPNETPVGTGGGGPTTPPPAGPTASPPGAVETNPEAAKGPAVSRFGMGKVLGYGALAGAGYGAYKGIPWAANKIDESNSMPMAYGGGWSPTPYGYGHTPYGDGMQTMGAG